MKFIILSEAIPSGLLNKVLMAGSVEHMISLNTLYSCADIRMQVVDKIVEVPQYVYQEKIIEVPRVVVQERVIPVPRKVVKEKLIEIPEVEYRDVAFEQPIEVTEEVKEEEVVEKAYTQVVQRPFEMEKVVEVPHIQHTYRNVMTPQYRHIPKPVEVPMTHYRPIPVEKLVDRNVPVPVELQIVQEYLCPKIEPRYKEVPVPVHVQRTIEHPVPKEAMGNPQLLPLYYQGSKEQFKGSFQPGGACYTMSSCCAPRVDHITEATAGTVEVLAQAGYPQQHPMGSPPPAPMMAQEQQPTPADQEPAQQQTPDAGTERMSTMQREMLAAAGRQANPYVQVSVTPLAPGQKSEINIQ